MSRYGGTRFGGSQYGRFNKVERSIEGYVQSTVAETERGPVQLPRGATGFSDAVVGESDRSGVTQIRDPDGFVTAIFAESNRGAAIYDRGADGFAQLSFAEAVRGPLTMGRDVNGFAQLSYGTSVRTSATFSRATDGYTAAVQADSVRHAVTLSRSAAGWSTASYGEVTRDDVRRVRGVTGFSSSIVAAANRDSLTFDRDTDGFASPASSDSIRVLVTLSRQIDGYISAIIAESTRDGVIQSRSADAYFQTIYGDSVGTNSLYRPIDGFTTTSSGSAELGTTAYYRTVTGYVSPIIGEPTVTRSVNRETTGFTDPSAGGSTRGASSLLRDIVGYSDEIVGVANNTEQLSQYGIYRYGQSQYGRVRTYSRSIRGYVRPFSGGVTREADYAGRESTGFSNTIEGDVTPVRSLTRGTSGFTGLSFGEIQRIVDVIRYPATIIDGGSQYGDERYSNSRYGKNFREKVFGYFNKSSGSIDRDPIDYVNRSTTGWTDPVRGIPRILTTNSGYTQPSAGSISRTITATLVVDGFTDAIAGEIRRYINLVPPVYGYTEPSVGEAKRHQIRADKTITGYTEEVWGVNGYPYWIIGGKEAREFITGVRNWKTLTLNFRANRDTLESAFRPLSSGAGKFGVIEYPDGSYQTVDRSSGEAQVKVIPPIGRGEIRTTNDYLIDEYEESVANQNQEIYDVELTLFGEEPKDGVTGERLEPSDTEWHFSFADGDVLTGRVEKDIGRGGSTIDGRVTVQMIVTEQEARVIEGSLNRQAATRIMEVPDGGDQRQDKNPDDRNTVTVTTPAKRDPDEKTIKSGDYVAQEWGTQHLNDQFFEITMTMGEKF